MNRFSERSAESELIDQPGLPFSDWEICLHELNVVNTYLGGHKITIEGVELLLEKLPVKKEIIICEIGCGGGDNLKAIHRWNKQQLPIKYIGVDINEACTDFAAKNCAALDADFICSDYREASFVQQPDIIFNSLFCHHFSNEQLVEMLSWMKKHSSAGFFINDLQRHPVAYHSIKILTKIFSRSYLVKNDGPVSVLRGFHKNEWQQLLSASGISTYSISWKWAFRYLVVIKNEQ